MTTETLSLIDDSLGRQSLDVRVDVCSGPLYKHI